MERGDGDYADRRTSAPLEILAKPFAVLLLPNRTTMAAMSSLAVWTSVGKLEKAKELL